MVGFNPLVQHKVSSSNNFVCSLRSADYSFYFTSFSNVLGRLPFRIAGFRWGILLKNIYLYKLLYNTIKYL